MKPTALSYVYEVTAQTAGQDIIGYTPTLWADIDSAIFQAQCDAMALHQFQGAELWSQRQQCLGMVRDHDMGVIYAGESRVFIKVRAVRKLN